MLPGWWVRLFYGEKGLAKYLGGCGSSLVGVSFSVDNIRVSYPDLVARLDKFGYDYRLPRRWRKKMPKDWRRRTGVLVVNIVDGVECLVGIRRGYVVRVQVVGSVEGVKVLDGVVGFLERVFGLKVSVEELVSRAITARPDPNKLKSVSWNVVRSAKVEWMFLTGFNVWLSGRVAIKVGAGGWLDVISSLRVGKSSGIVLGLMKKIVEDGVDNYVVVIVVPNRKLGRQLI